MLSDGLWCWMKSMSWRLYPFTGKPFTFIPLGKKIFSTYIFNDIWFCFSVNLNIRNGDLDLCLCLRSKICREEKKRKVLQILNEKKQPFYSEMFFPDNLQYGSCWKNISRFFLRLPFSFKAPADVTAHLCSANRLAFCVTVSLEVS